MVATEKINITHKLEKAVIGAILINREAISTVNSILVPTDFEDQRIAVIYEEALILYSKQLPIDTILIVERLEKIGKLEEAGGMKNILDLSDQVASMANVEAHAHIIREKAITKAIRNDLSSIQFQL